MVPIRSALAALAGVSLVVPLVVTAPTAQAAPPLPVLVDVRASHRAGGVDRVVFQFRGGLPASRRAGYVDRLFADGSGRPLRVAGRAILEVRMEQADAHDGSGSTAPARVAFALPNVLTVVQSGDFEGVTTYGIGLAKRTRFTVSTLAHPNRVVVDVRAAFPTVTRKVWFLDQDRFVAGTAPFFVPVTRPVRIRHRAVGLMDRLFAGPTDAELATGLRLLRSKARSFADLRIANDVARVRLTRHCSSGGSTVTVAGEIMPTLRQLAAVKFVKIFDPAGTTETPTGRSDSIPACLEP